MRSLIVFLLLSCLVPSALAANTTSSKSKKLEPSTIKVLVALGPTTFFLRDGRAHGLEYAWLLAFEKYINRQSSSKQPRRLRFIPVDQGELIPALYAGRGDLAAGMIPEFAAVENLVLQTQPFTLDEWCIVAHRNEFVPQSLDELEGLSLSIPSVSYGRRLLQDLNVQRSDAGLQVLPLADAGLGVSAEAVFAEINKKTSTLSLASRLTIGMWQPVFPSLRRGACLAEKVPLVWAVNKQKTDLLKELNAFIAAEKSSFVARGIKLTQQYLHSDGVRVSTGAIDPFDKMALFAPLFQLAANANSLDWLLLAAIGQRETGLEHIVRAKGATGVMQVDSKTAQRLGIVNPNDKAANIEAAARYLRYLKKRYTHENIAQEEQLFFMLAAYNAGEGRLQSIRKKAAAQGLDPNRWHGHVEDVARQMVGDHLLAYVSAVMRYYLALQLTERPLADDGRPLLPESMTTPILDEEKASSVSTAVK